MPNEIVSLLRGKYPDDPRSDSGLTLIYGDWAAKNRPDWFESYPDFANEYRDLKRGFRPSMAQEFKGSVGSAVGKLQATGWGGLAGGADVVGANKIRDYLSKAAEEQEIQASEFTPSVGSYKDIYSVGDALRYATYGAGQIVPSAAETAITAGAGALIGAGVGSAAPGAGTVAGGAAGAVAGVIEKEAVKAAIRQAAKIGARAGVAASTIPNSIGEIYNETKNPGLAFGFGTLTGALDMLPEGYVAGKFFAEAGKKVVTQESVTAARSFAKEFAKTAAREGLITVPAEGLTESAQEFINIAAAKLNRGEDPATVTAQDYERLLNAGLIGSIGGAVMAPVAGAGEMRQNQPLPQVEAPPAQAANAAPTLSPDVAAAVAAAEGQMAAMLPNPMRGLGSYEEELSRIPSVQESAGPMEFGDLPAHPSILRAAEAKRQAEADARARAFANSDQGAASLRAGLLQQANPPLSGLNEIVEPTNEPTPFDLAIAQATQSAAKMAGDIVAENPDMAQHVAQVADAVPGAVAEAKNNPPDPAPTLFKFREIQQSESDMDGVTFINDDIVENEYPAEKAEELFKDTERAVNRYTALLDCLSRKGANG